MSIRTYIRCPFCVLCPVTVYTNAFLRAYGFLLFACRWHCVRRRTIPFVSRFSLARRSACVSPSSPEELATEMPCTKRPCAFREETCGEHMCSATDWKKRSWRTRSVSPNINWNFSKFLICKFIIKEIKLKFAQRLTIFISRSEYFKLCILKLNVHFPTNHLIPTW